MKSKQATETVEAQAPWPNGDEKRGLWPVTGPEDLTDAHVPERLRAELLRQEAHKLRVLGEALMETVESRNELVAALNTALRFASKDSQRLQLSALGPKTTMILRDLGMVRDTPGQP